MADDKGHYYPPEKPLPGSENVKLDIPPPLLPPWWSAPIPKAASVNASGTSLRDRLMSFDAHRTPLPIVYGLDRLGPIVTMKRVTGGKLYLRLVWCIGEVNAIQVTLEDGTLPSGITITNYKGTTSQGVDPTLAGIEATYNDTLVLTRDNVTFGVAYSVVVVNKGVLSGFPRFVATVSGKKVLDPRLSSWGALQINPNANGTVSMGDVNDVGSTDFTVEARVKWDSIAGTTDTEIVSKKASMTGAGNAGWALYATTAQVLKFAVSDGTNQVLITTNYTLVVGDDINVAVAINRGSGQARVYIDGYEDASSPFDISSVTGSLDNTAALRISNVTATEDGFTIDEFRLWNDVRSRDEIYDNQYAEIDETDASLYGYWRLNDGTGSTAVDSKSTNDGTVSGSTSWADSLNVVPDGVIQYTDTAGLCLGDLLSSTLYGLGVNIDRYTLGLLADFNEEVLSDGLGYSEARNKIGYTIKKRSSVINHIEALRMMARCSLVNRGGTFYFIPDRSASSAVTLTDADIASTSVRVTPNDTRNSPNCVVLWYTNTSNSEWREEKIEVCTSGVTAGTELRRELILKMPGIQSRTMAIRIATERLNAGLLRRFRVEFLGTDMFSRYEEGDVITLNLPELGGGPDDVKILSRPMQQPGIFQIVAEEHNNSVYSNEIADNNEPAYPDPSDSPENPPTVTGVTIADEVELLGNGLYNVFLNISWTDPAYSYLREYIVTVKYGSHLVSQFFTSTNSNNRVGPVEDGETYTIEVVVVSTSFVQGTASSDNHVASGTAPLPDWSGGVIDAVEIGGEVRLEVIVEASDVDIAGYEWRYLDFHDTLYPDGYDIDGAQASNWSLGTGTGTLTNGTDGEIVIAPTTTSDVRFDNTVVGELANLDYTGGITIRAAIEVLEITGGTGNEVVYLGDNQSTKANGFAVQIAGVGSVEANLGTSYTTAPTQVSIWVANSQNGAQIKIRYAVMFMDLQDWDRALLLDRTPQLRYTSKVIPEGLWRVYAKPFDSVKSVSNPVGQYSVEVKALTVEVTSDADAFFLGDLEFGLAAMTTETNVFEFSLGRGDPNRYWVPVGAGSAESVFTTTPLDSNYSNPLDSYGLTGIVPELITNAIAFATDVNATINRRTSVSVFPSVGDPGLVTQTQYSLQATPTTWVSKTNDVFSVTAQNFRLRYTCASGGYIRIEKPNMRLLANAVPRNEQFEGTSLSSGATTIDLTRIYSYVKDISVEILDGGSIPYTHKVDNIILGDPSSFDLYFYRTDTGAQVAVDYRLHFEGI